MSSSLISDCLLSAEGIRASYDRNEVLHGVNLNVNERSIVALLGHNGAGKTTLIRTIFGLHPRAGGTVMCSGRSLPNLHPERRVAVGMAYVPQGANVFRSLSVTENLRVAMAGVARGEMEERIAFAFDVFPILKDRPRHMAGQLSGGQRQMLAVSLALVKRPRLLILDEPTLGIAPNLVQRLMASLATIRDSAGASILLIDQAVGSAIAIADFVHILKMGNIVHAGPAANLRGEADLWQYF